MCSSVCMSVSSLLLPESVSFKCKYFNKFKCYILCLAHEIYIDVCIYIFQRNVRKILVISQKSFIPEALENNRFLGVFVIRRLLKNLRAIYWLALLLDVCFSHVNFLMLDFCFKFCSFLSPYLLYIPIHLFSFYVICPKYLLGSSIL